MTVLRGVLAAISLCTTALAWGQSQVMRSTPQSVPDHITYRQLFQEMAALRHKGDELDKQGKDGSGLRYFVHRKIGLDAVQSSAFNAIVAEYEQRVSEKDTEAHRIISAYRAQYPKGRVPHGQTKAPIPPELTRLQAERDAITLETVDRLRNQLGPDTFARLDAQTKKGQQRNLVPMTR